MRTRYACRRLVLPPAESNLDAYADALLRDLSAHGTDAVLPSVDASLEALHRRRADFERMTAPAIGAADAVELASSKTRTLELAGSLGIKTPRSISVESGTDLAAAAAELGLPAVLKPEASWRDLPGGGGVRLSPRLVVADGEAFDGPALLQEVIPGRRETVKLFRANGRTLAKLVIECARTWPPLGGSSVMRTTIAPPLDIAEQAERLVAAIGLEGYSEVEFRRNRDGAAVLMEVNARLSQSIEVAIRAGIDFARMQLEWARGGTVEPVSRYAVGVRVGWLAGDIRLLAAALAGAGPPPRPERGATVRAIFRDYLVRHATVEAFALDDLRPVGSALAFTVRGALRRPGAPPPSASQG
jgi:carbamoyl-phosphate synthase large subunit